MEDKRKSRNGIVRFCMKAVYEGTSKEVLAGEWADMM